jgi:Amt family ammonium transporter
MTFGIMKVVDKLIGIKVTKEEEQVGLDISEHGEEAYGGLN